MEQERLEEEQESNDEDNDSDEVEPEVPSDEVEITDFNAPLEGWRDCDARHLRLPTKAYVRHTACAGRRRPVARASIPLT